MGAFIVVLILLVIIAIAASSGSQQNMATQNNNRAKEVQKAQEIELKETPDAKGEPFQKFYCEVAGLYHHVSNPKPGAFFGFAAPEPNNQYDHDAIAIYDNDITLIGYVPRADHDIYFDYFPDKAASFVAGYYYLGYDYKMYCKVYFVRVHSWEYARDELDSLARSFVKNGKCIRVDGYDSMMEYIDGKINERDAKIDTNLNQ